MRKKHTVTSLFDLARKTTETAAASAQTIHHRTRRMAKAGLTPNQRDRKEFALMGWEKLEAAAEASAHVGTEWLRLNQRLGDIAAQQAIINATAMFSLFGNRNVGQMMQTQSAWNRKSLALANQAGSELVTALTRSASKGLKPVHSRATKNARRLKPS